MKFPWVSRAHFELQSALLDLQRELIARVTKENEELRALFNMKSNFEIVEQTESGVTLKMKPLATQSTVAGRAGFRSKRVVGEAQTVPAPSDSVAMLEKRVAEAKQSQEAKRAV